MPETVSSARARAVKLLAAVSDNASLDAEVLLAKALDRPRSWLFAHAEDALSDNARDDFAKLLERRLRGEPAAYLLGNKEFWSLQLEVDATTLIPRPETELLVELALSHCRSLTRPAILDLGTGSGAVALALASESPHAAITAVDISPAALAIARHNADNLGIKNVSFIQSDWFAALAGQTFDLIVSNPPYVKANDPGFKDGPLAWEPGIALAAGADGLDAIRKIASAAPAVMDSGAPIFIEHGNEQAGAVQRILRRAGFLDPRTHRDLNNWQRVTEARLSSHINARKEDMDHGEN